MLKRSLLLLAVCFMFFSCNMLLKNQGKEAFNLMFNAEYYLEMDSFKLALEGNPKNNEVGFLYIIEKYEATEAGKLAAHYAGVCYLHLGQPKEALDYLMKYNPTNETIRATNYGLRGDAHSEMEEYEEAAKWYIKAAEVSDNELTTPLYYWKTGLCYEQLKEYQKALNVYSIIKEEYPNSIEGEKIEKYINRTKNKLTE
jgi:tetratricopeptide (TPR) repeat protein